MKMPVRIYNRFLDFQGEIDTYLSLQLGRSYHGIATFELHVNRYMHEAKKLEKGNLIALNKQKNKAAVIMTKEIALDENGKETENFKLTGCTLDGLLTRRLTEPPSNESHDRVKGNAETVMKHYVNKHFVHPDDPNRIFPHMEVATDRKRGNYFEWESRFKIVADELENISVKSGLGWGLFADFKTKKLIFDVIEAKDLTQGNPFGNHPVFFSPEFETIKSQGFINSDNDLKTVGYVGGQGEGAERKIIKIGNKTGWDRIETFIDARDVGEGEEDEKLTPEQIEQQLTERGQSKLSEMGTIYTLEAEILTPTQESPFQYEKDFDLGDKVDVVNKSWGLKMTAPITEFMEIHEPGGFRLEGTFGRSRPTLISKIKNKFDELDGVEKQELPAQIAVETKEYTNRKVSEEEKKRIEQAKENLQTSKQYTEEYAEKAIPKQPVPPDNPVEGDQWIDTSGSLVVLKIFNGTDWDAVQGPEGLPGLPGEDGKTPYFHTAYSDSANGSVNFSTTDPTDRDYIGTYTDYTALDSSDPSKYKWQKVKGEKGDRGLQGLQGPEGKQGIPGEPGEDGRTPYTHIAYADDEQGNGLAFSPDNKPYMGMYVDYTSTDSNNPADYKWSLIKGRDGSQGVPGPKGEDGKTPYFHTAYANSADGTSGFSTTDSANKLYIGQYTDFNQNDSSTPSDYSWTRIKGDKGEKGDQGPLGLQGIQGPKGDQGIQGPKGTDGKSSYTHIAYANSADGTVDFSTSDGTNKEYVGMYVDFTSTDSTNPADYNWTLIKGRDGSQGIPGPKGDDGNTSYLHIAYANNSTGTSGFSTTDSTGKLYIGQYTDYSSADSTSPSRYKWSRIKGEQGAQGPKGDKGNTGSQGPQGPQGPNIVDTNTSFGVNWLIADYIKSLNGLNVGNGQFVVDGSGNVSFAGNLKGASGSFAGDLEAGSLLIGPEKPVSPLVQPEGNLIRFKMLNGETNPTWGTPVSFSFIGNVFYVLGQQLMAVDSDLLVTGEKIKHQNNGNPGIELRATHGGTPYIDFSKDSLTDYHARLILDTLTRLAMRGITQLHFDTSDTTSFTGGGFTRLASMMSKGAEFVVGADSNPRVWSKDIYNRTYSAGGNVVVTDSGTLGRSTSASKYKLDIENQFANELDQLNHSLGLLDVFISHWFDKSEAEITSKECEKGNLICSDNFKLKRHVGLIAEHVEKAGLTEHVSYNEETNEIEGIEYDRLWVHLLPIVRNARERITTLEEKLNKQDTLINNLLERVAALENAK